MSGWNSEAWHAPLVKLVDDIKNRKIFKIMNICMLALSIVRALNDSQTINYEAKKKIGGEKQCCSFSVFTCLISPCLIANFFVTAAL